MNTLHTFVLLGFFTVLFSCTGKNSSNHQTDESIAIAIDTLHVTDEDLGIGCITEYYEKGTMQSKNIYVQTSSKDDKSWVNYMMINGKKEVFESANDATLSNDENSYSLNLENENYTIQIKAKMGDPNIEADATPAMGTIKITRKSDQKSITVEFEGGTAC